MTDYPNLTSMGVHHPEHIDHYSISSIEYNDTLRIVYKRPKGSLLSQSRTYKFPRVQRNVASADGGPGNVVMEINPVLRAAVDELQALTEEIRTRENTTASVLEELKLLEEDVAMRLDCIRSKIDRIANKP